jgi:hypothetical protein
MRKIGRGMASIRPNITNDFFIIPFLEENTEQVWLDRA